MPKNRGKCESVIISLFIVTSLIEATLLCSSLAMWSFIGSWPHKKTLQYNTTLLYNFGVFNYSQICGNHLRRSGRQKENDMRYLEEDFPYLEHRFISNDKGKMLFLLGLGITLTLFFFYGSFSSLKNPNAQGSQPVVEWGLKPWRGLTVWEKREGSQIQYFWLTVT